MNKKTLAFAGIASLIGLSAISLVSANNTSGTLTTNAKTSTTMGKMFKEGKWERGFGHMKKWMMKGRWMFGSENSAIQTAIQNNDYTAFLAARNADTKKPSGMTAPTQDQFNEMVTMSQKRQAAETALANNDYNAFVAATTPTQAEFNERATQHKSRQAVETAIANNDYAAFQTAVKGTPMEGKVTAEQFAKMVTRQTNKSAK